MDDVVREVGMDRIREASAKLSLLDRIMGERNEAMTLLSRAIDLFHGTHELCDEVNSEEWLWRWQVLTLLDDSS